MLTTQIVCLNSVQNPIDGAGNWVIFVSLITIVRLFQKCIIRL